MFRLLIQFLGPLDFRLANLLNMHLCEQSVTNYLKFTQMFTYFIRTLLRAVIKVLQ
jgi:hypothetical protein